MRAAVLSVPPLMLHKDASVNTTIFLSLILLLSFGNKIIDLVSFNLLTALIALERSFIIPRKLCLWEGILFSRCPTD